MVSSGHGRAENVQEASSGSGGCEDRCQRDEAESVDWCSMQCFFLSVYVFGTTRGYACLDWRLRSRPDATRSSAPAELSLLSDSHLSPTLLVVPLSPKSTRRLHEVAHASVDVGLARLVSIPPDQRRHLQAGRSQARTEERLWAANDELKGTLLAL